jgi:hypothetical protein
MPSQQRCNVHNRSRAAATVLCNGIRRSTFASTGAARRRYIGTGSNVEKTQKD